MDPFTKDELNQLATAQGEWCVSFYMPTHKIGQDVLQDPIVLKNLVRNAEDQLVTLGLRRPDAQALLEPVSGMVLDGDFWQHQENGLAIFVGPGIYEYYRTRITFNDLALVSNRFHLKQMLPLLSNDGEFYVLALSQGNVRLLRGTRERVEQMELGDMPKSLADTLQGTVAGQQIQFHFAAREPPGTGGQRPTMFSGHGAGKDDADNDILNYFNQVDNGIRELLHDSRAPLVIAGVEYLHPIYRQTSHYNNLTDHGIIGNPDDLRAQELHQRAWAIVEPLFSAAQQEVAERYRALMGQHSPRASDSVEDIVKAAFQGRVDTLFVDRDAQRWGQYKTDDGEVEVHDSPQRGDYDLLDASAVQTIVNGGNVFAVAHHDLPGHHQAAAIYRY